ncbi:DUF2459 domain-containing protein [filamentous cyanobacterium CCP1]|nr:DUF2459 domain-containing protein [filamentous cyanobacterium CCP1]
MLLFSLAVGAAIVLGWVSLPPKIIPPRDPAAPVTVYVMNQDFHSRLILPNQEDEFVQYAYGDWQYFALYEQNVRTALAALFVPTQGALGRRGYRDLQMLEQETDELYNGSLLSFEVASGRASQLFESLNVRFEQNIDTAIVNQRNRMTFVQDDQDYTLLHNSNHELVRWLEALDCEVEGFVMWSGFRVEQPS